MEGLDETVGQIIKAVRGAVESAGTDMSQVAGVGMGVPGQHKSREGIVLWSPNFKDWNGVQLLAPIRADLGVEVFMGNDVNVAALGEYQFGAGRGAGSLVMLTLGTGIGGGIILGGRLWLGASEGAAEVGHQVIIPDGPMCGCGRAGHLEALAARDAIVERAARKIQSGRNSVLIEDVDWPQWSVTPADIAKAAADGDEVALETMQETGYYIGLGVSNLINVLSPEVVIIGGGISQGGDALWGPIHRTVQAHALTESRRACRVVPAELGDDAGVMGGVTLVLQEENDV
jgi:glucokinase